MTDQQLIHKANGIRRVKTALMFPSGEVGTFYSNPFRIKMEISGSALIDIVNRLNNKPKPWYVSK
jgi:hypothetical protein